MGGELNLDGCSTEGEDGGHTELPKDSSGPRDLGKEI